MSNPMWEVDCHRCEDKVREELIAQDRWTEAISRRMILCPECGNKRCPKATDHKNACTGSNESGQPGSDYR